MLLPNLVLNHPSVRMFAAALIVSLFAIDARPLEVLYDFSKPAQGEDWTSRDPKQDKLELSTKFATPGSRSLHFSTPKWEPGLNQYPAINGVFDPVDFTGYDRLVVELVNTAPVAAGMRLRIADSKTPFRQGFAANNNIAPLSRLQWVIDISETNPLQLRKIDISDVVHMHMWVPTPADDIDLYIDRIYLAKGGEELPAAHPSLSKQVVGLLTDSAGLRDGKALVEDLDGWLADASGDQAKWLQAVRDDAAQRVADIETTLDAGGEMDDAERQQLVVALDNLSRYRDRITALRDLRQDYAAATSDAVGDRWNNVLVATASPMQRVLPRDVPLPSSVDTARKVQVKLARNEEEAFQVVVLPFLDPLEQVRVEVGELRNDAGDTLPSDAVELETVGYVKTYLPQHPLSDLGQYVGWWPDPLLPFLDAADVARGDAQSFFVRLRATRDTAPGAYHGKVRVAAAGIDQPYELDLVVHVYDFVLPDRSPLPLSMGFNYAPLQQMADLADPNYSPQKWRDQWQTQKFVWADFLADHYITYDYLYGSGPDWPDFEVLDYLESTGQLDVINLGHFGTGDANAFDKIDALVAQQLPPIQASYEKAKERGWLDRSFIYGFDERPKDNFPVMEQFVAKMSDALPGVEVMTTAGAYWDYWGEAEGIDIWAPIISNWNESRVAKYKSEGKDVWWYTCIASPPPFPNHFIDQDVIDTRVMMGMMTARYRPDGCLYYAMLGFNRPNRSPLNVNTQYLTTGPFTSWNPKSFAENHGDGNLVYPGADGSPISSFRLENFRDGLEDFAYYTILESRINDLRSVDQPTAQQRQWLTAAEKLLVVPEDLVKATNIYTRDPAAIQQYRQAIADAIVAAP